MAHHLNVPLKFTSVSMIITLRHCEKAAPHYLIYNVNVIFSCSRLALLLTAGSVFGLSSGVAASQLDSLLANSPFGSVKTGQPVDSGNQPLEFRGISEENGQQFFSVLDTTTKRSRWISVNDSSGDLVVKNYNAEANTLTVEQNGHALTLTLKSGPRVAQNIPPPMPQGMPPGNNGLPGQTMTNSMVGKGPEAQRLQMIAEEIRRRRALRQQPNIQMPLPNPNAAPGTNGPAAGPVPNPVLPVIPASTTGQVPNFNLNK